MTTRSQTNEQTAEAMYQAIMPFVRAKLLRRGISYDAADEVADGVMAGCRFYAESEKRKR